MRQSATPRCARRRGVPLGAACGAACGSEPPLSPELIRGRIPRLLLPGLHRASGGGGERARNLLRPHRPLHPHVHVRGRFDRNRAAPIPGPNRPASRALPPLGASAPYPDRCQTAFHAEISTMDSRARARLPSWRFMRSVSASSMNRFLCSAGSNAAARPRICPTAAFQSIFRATTIRMVSAMNSRWRSRNGSVRRETAGSGPYAHRFRPAVRGRVSPLVQGVAVEWWPGGTTLHYSECRPLRCTASMRPGPGRDPERLGIIVLETSRLPRFNEDAKLGPNNTFAGAVRSRLEIDVG